MFILLSPPPLPDAPQWSGRRWFAALDALVWPMTWLVGIAAAAFPSEVVGWVGAAGAIGSAAVRCRRAMWLNHRYRFTTLRWGRLLGALLALGILLKVAQLI